MRGDIWTIVGSGYASKPRPAIVIQSELTDVFDSVVVCLLTSDDSVESVTRGCLSCRVNKMALKRAATSWLTR